MKTIWLLIPAIIIFISSEARANDSWTVDPIKQSALNLAYTDEVPLRGVVKFKEGKQIAFDDGVPALYAEDHDAVVHLTEIQRILHIYNRTLIPLIRNNAVIDELERRSGDASQMRNLRLYASFRADDRSAREWLPLLEALNKSPLIEVAYLESQDSRNDSRVLTADDWIALPGFTPAFTHLQGYMTPAPKGIGAGTSWTQPGGTGKGVRVMVYDNAFRPSHEDVPSVFFNAGNNPVSDAHGTAVLGVIGAPANKIGIKGIAYDASIGFQRSASVVESHAERLIEAALMLEPGDVLLTEVGKQVNALGFQCECNPTQANSVPIEFHPAEFDAIRAITDMGITVVETAGNGCVDFGSVAFNEAFGNGDKTSGAIWVAASKAEQRAPMCYTNFGKRVDLHAWGEAVMTLSYLRPDEIPVFNKGPDRLYVPNFGGTSAAGAIVAGAVASLQGRAWALQGSPLLPFEVRDLLVETGTPQNTDLGRLIGPMPSLEAIPF